MRLHIDNGELHAGRATRERIDLGRAAAVLAGKGHRFAAAIAHGDLSTPTGARALARMAGLLTVETSEARLKGLLQ